MTGGEKEFLNVFTVKGGNLLLSQLLVAQSFKGNVGLTKYDGDC